MGYEFTLTLNRVITDEESLALREGGCAGATITSASLPPDGLVVTQLDFDEEAPNLADAIQSALDAVKVVPSLRVDSLDVPPQPSGLPDDDEVATEGSNQLELTAGPPNGAALPAEEADVSAVVEPQISAVVSAGADVPADEVDVPDQEELKTG